MSKQSSASARKAPGARRTLFFIGQNNLWRLSARRPVFTETYFLSVKTAFGFGPQGTRCSPNPIFYRSKQLSASVRKAPGAHGTLFFIGRNSLRLLTAKHPVFTEPYFLSVKPAFGFYPQRTRCSPNPIFIGQNSLRLLSATHTVLTEPYFLSVKTAVGF